MSMDCTLTLDLLGRVPILLVARVYTEATLMLISRGFHGALSVKWTCWSVFNSSSVGVLVEIETFVPSVINGIGDTSSIGTISMG